MARRCPVCGSRISVIQILKSSGFVSEKALICDNCKTILANPSAWRRYEGMAIVGMGLSLILARFLPKEVFGIESVIAHSVVILLLGLVIFISYLYWSFPLEVTPTEAQSRAENTGDTAPLKKLSGSIARTRWTLILFAIPSIIISVGSLLLGNFLSAVLAFSAGAWVGTGLIRKSIHWLFAGLLLAYALWGFIQSLSNVTAAG